MPATLEDLKTSLRIDGDADDTLLQHYLNAANNYVKNAVADSETGSDAFFNDDNVDDMVTTATLAIASTYYEYRSSVTCMNIRDVDPVANSIICQLQGQYALWEMNQNAKD